MWDEEYITRNELRIDGINKLFTGLKTDQCIKANFTVGFFDKSTHMKFWFLSSLSNLTPDQNKAVVNLCTYDKSFCKNLQNNGGCYRLNYVKYIDTLQGTISNSTVAEILFHPFNMTVEIYRDKTMYYCHSKFGIKSIVHVDYDHVIPEICWTSKISVEICTPYTTYGGFY